MSRPWNSFLHMRVAADSVAATLQPGWAGSASRVEAQRSVGVAAPPASMPGVAAADGHAEAVAAVLQEIGTQAPLKGARLHVELASALLHLDVVEGDFADRSDRQLQAIASACVAEMLGEAALEHDIRWQLQRDDRHLLIVAIARARLAMLEAAAQAAGMRLASVRPEFVNRWNESGRTVRPGHSVFAVCAPGDLAIAAVVDGAITNLSIGPGVDFQDAAAAGDASAPPASQLYAKPGPPLLVTSSTGTSRGAFSSTGPMPLDGIDALDVRVDRLLYGIGQDPAGQSAFVLATSGGRSMTASQRWSVAGPRGVPA